MGKLIFFILMPIIFEFICFLISHNDLNWHDDKISKEICLFSVLLIIDYIIEIIYCILVKKELGVWIFSNEYSQIEETYGVFGMFAFLAIAYIISTLCLGCLFSFLDVFPIVHTIVLIICFSIFCNLELSCIHDGKDSEYFETQTYQEDESTIYLVSLGDAHETSGSIGGRSIMGSGYIYGKIESTYKFYYAFMDGDRVIIRDIVYDENNTNLYEIKDNSEPRIVFHKYYREYTCEKNHNLYSEYYVYDIYIPSISNDIIIDFE